MAKKKSSSLKRQLVSYFLLEDIEDRHPKHDVSVYLGRSSYKKEQIPFDNELEVRESIHEKAYLVFFEHKGLYNHFDFSDYFFPNGEDYFDDNGIYYPGEIFDYHGITIEIIVSSRTFEGLSLSYYEPTDRLVKYLKLHREDGCWAKPQISEKIIETIGKECGWETHNTYIKIRKSELLDYLAARKCALLVQRYSERQCEVHNTLPDMPESFNSKKTKYGHKTWIIDKGIRNHDCILYFSRLWESFWLDPASQPRRWDARIPSEVNCEIEFVDGDGERRKYDQSQQLTLLSFKPSIFKSFLEIPNRKISFLCLSNIVLTFEDGRTLNGCINPEGQFQAFFKDIVRFEADKQRYLAGYSESKKSHPSFEFVRTYIHGEWPEVIGFDKILTSCLEAINAPWNNRFGETLLLTPSCDNISPFIIIGPTSQEWRDLADIMLELRKLLIPDKNIARIKKELDYSSLCSNADVYKKIKSIVFTKLLFKNNNHEGIEGESVVLDVINDLRIAKAHPTKIQAVLDRFSIPKETPRKAFLYIMCRFCTFLYEFKKITETVLDVKVDKSDEFGEDVWRQLYVAKTYFEKPF